MESGIQHLEIASGLKESLLKAGLTVQSIALKGPDAVSARIRDRGIRNKDSLRRSQKDCG